MDSIPAGRYFPGVLIVDYESLSRSFLRSALEATARVIEAEDGERALEVLQARTETTVDLVLVDHVLPKLSGLEVLQVTKRCWPWIPVVIITGFSSEDLAVRALRAGASDYLRKPIPLDVLMQTVGTLVTAGAKRTLTGSAGHPNVRRALAFIVDHFAEAITLEDTAREAGLSRYHFCRLFHHETGVTFLEYLHYFRICRAKALLADRYLRITEVAYTVGFSDLSHFDRTFRKMVGRSPREYRASLKSA
jgi:two-component system response regulator YesN